MSKTPRRAVACLTVLGAPALYPAFLYTDNNVRPG